MKNKTFRNYYIFSVIGTLLISFYPLHMGFKVVTDMIINGVVKGEDYPKYVIPYTPISLAVIIGVLFMPLIIKIVKKCAFLIGTLLSLAVFFISEIIIENMVIVEKSVLADWQMYMCIFTEPERVKIKAGDIPIGSDNSVAMILSGDYNPMYKLHFYLISVVIIISLLNCVYGFGQMIKNKDKNRLIALMLQAISSTLFLGLCILACFTAFYRTGDIYVSPLSAFLMGLFFVVFGITMGIFTGSFLHKKNIFLSVIIPSIVAILTTIFMYVGEMILLSGNVYRFGVSPLFSGLGKLTLAPIDIVIIFLSGCITMLIMSIVVQFEKVNTADFTEDEEIEIYDFK